MTHLNLTPFDDEALDEIIRTQSDAVFAAAEKLSRKREDVKEAQKKLKHEERSYNLTVAEAERRRSNKN